MDGKSKRHYIPGQIWHITHRCYKREFLLKLTKARPQAPYTYYFIYQTGLFKLRCWQQKVVTDIQDEKPITTGFFINLKIGQLTDCADLLMGFSSWILWGSNYLLKLRRCNNESKDTYLACYTSYCFVGGF